MMDTSKAFAVLNIEITKDAGEIKKNYLMLLKKTNPEDHPNEFMELRLAYETALDYAKKVDETEIQEEVQDETPFGVLKKSLENIYEDVRKRRDKEIWEELLHQDICESLDTSDEAQKQILLFLMDHYYLPDDIWGLLEQHFQLTSQEKQLRETFDGNFIDFLVSRIKNISFLPYDPFVVLGDVTNVDSWIRDYFDLKRMIDEDSKDTDVLQDRIHQLEAYRIYHPYMEIEQMRVERIVSPDIVQPLERLNRLLESNPESIYVQTMVGAEFFAQKDYATAEKLWNQVLTKYPQNSFSLLHLAELDLIRGALKESKARIMDVLEWDYFNEDAKALLHRVNEQMIKKFQDDVSQLTGEAREKAALELGWCYYEDDQKEACANLIDQEIHTLTEGYSYQNLMSRVLVQLEQYERAKPLIERWINMIEHCEDEPEEEQKKRKNRYSLSLYIYGICLGSLEQWAKTFTYFDRAIELAKDNQQDMLLYLERKAYYQQKAKQYSECIDTCEQILSKQSDYYPAMIFEMESYYELHKLQPLMDLFYKSLQIVNNYPRPYVLVVKALYYCDYTQEAEDVLKTASENGIHSDTLQFYGLLIQSKAKELNEPDLLIHKFEQLIDTHNDSNTDLTDLSDVWFEKGLLNRRLRQYKAAIECYEKAIAIKPKDYYYLNLSDIYGIQEKYDIQLSMLMKIYDKFKDNSEFFYDLGRCYINLKWFDDGMKCLQEGLKINPDDFRIHDYLFDYYMKQYQSNHKKADYEKTLWHAKEQIRISPRCYSYVNMGLIHMEVYQNQEALDCYEKAKEYDNNDIYIYNNSGYTYEVMRDMEKAVENLKQSISLDTSLETLPYYNLAKCYIIMGDWQQAHQTYELMRKKTENPETALYQELLLCIDQNDLKTGLDIAQRMLKSEKKYSYLQYYYISRLFELLQDAKSRKKYFDMALRTKPSFPYLLRLDHLFQDGDQKHALKLALSNDISALKNTIPVNHHARIWIQGLTMQVMWESGFALVAKSIAKKSIMEQKKLQEGNDPVYYPEMGKNRAFYEIMEYVCLGLINKAKLHVEQMEKMYACAICRKMECYRCYEAKAAIAEAEKEYEKAVEYLSEAIRIAPEIKRYGKKLEQLKKKAKRK